MIVDSVRIIGSLIAAAAIIVTLVLVGVLSLVIQLCVALPAAILGFFVPLFCFWCAGDRVVP